ncbi:MAG TPA: iron ABC transporter substrate-binding protein, partial [Nocardiopsis listeri]|nr:iron ABC transporter substrate-binding protein [Nocardiopsis listeri]
MQSVPRPFAALSLTLVSALALTSCSTGQEETEDTAVASDTVEVEDNNGTQTVDTPPALVVALDNRTFQTLSDWGVELSAGAV